MVDLLSSLHAVKHAVMGSKREPAMTLQNNLVEKTVKDQLNDIAILPIVQVILLKIF